MAETERMTSLPFPVLGKGIFASWMASDISVLTAGSSKTSALCNRMFRTRVPLPLRSFWGSGIFGPDWRKHRLTPLAAIASEKMASDGRSVGEKPITKKL